MAVLRSPDGRETPLAADRTTLGRAPDCDLVLDDPAVAPHHASILRTDRGWLLVDESGGLGVVVQGVSVANHFLRDSETLSLGGHALTFSDRGSTLVGGPHPAVAPAAAPAARSCSTPTTRGAVTPPAVASPAAAPDAAVADTLLASEASRAAASEGRRVVFDPPPPRGHTLPAVPAPAPIAAPPPFGELEPATAARGPAPTREPVPRTTASIYDMGAPVTDDDRPFVDTPARRPKSYYSMGDEGGPRASLDPVVDVYTLGRPGEAAGGSNPSVYSLGTAPVEPRPDASGASVYALGTAPAEARPDPSGRSVYAMGPAPNLARAAAAPATPPVRSAPTPSGPQSFGAGAHPPAPRPGDSWSWVQPEPAKGRRPRVSGRPGRGLLVMGLVLVVLGLVLVGVAFVLGLSLDDVRRALSGAR